MPRSLNVRWDREGFHKRLAELATVSTGDSVLDLGCGRGPTLPHLMERVGSGGQVVAMDRNAGLLQEIEERHTVEIAAGCLRVVKSDIKGELPFREPTFDVIVCQNVLECVPDRKSLILEVERILKPGGRMLLGHHDFDGVILASDDRTLTRQLIHGYADLTEEWQDVSEGQMGRLLPELVAAAGFVDAATETILFVDLDLTPQSYARAYLDWVCELAPQIGVVESETKRWRTALEARSVRAAFYFAVPWVYVIARKHHD